MNTIAGILLDDFIETAVMIDQDTVIDGSVRFQRHLDVSNLVVENLMNSKDINNIIHNGIRRNNKDVVNLPKLTIVGNVTFKVLYQSIVCCFRILSHSHSNRIQLTRSISTTITWRSIWEMLSI